MINSFKNIIKLTNKSLKPYNQLVFKQYSFISTQQDKVSKEVNQENREIYTKDQKKKILEEQFSNKNSEFNEDQLIKDYFSKEPSNYFGRSNDDYFKTLNGNNKKEQEIDQSDNEIEEEAIEDIEYELDNLQKNQIDKSNKKQKNDQKYNSDFSDLSEEEDHIASISIQDIKAKRESNNN